MALPVALSYVLWRATTLGSGSTLLLSIPLLIAEVSAVVHLGLIRFQTRHPQPTATPPEAEAPGQSVDIVVVAVNADLAEVERTLVGCSTLPGRHRVHIVDGPRRPSVYEIARSASAAYTPGISSGIDGLTRQLAADDCADLVVWLDAGDIPMPGLVAGATPHFDDPSTAILQVGRDLLNPDSLAHSTRGRDEQAFVREVVGPSMGHRGVGPWLGSGSVLRRNALVADGALDPDDRSPIQQALVRLHRAGWTSAFDHRPLVGTMAPDRLDEYLAERRTLTLDALAHVGSEDGPFLGGGLTAAARWSHIARALAHGAGIRQLVYLVVLVVTLLTGVLPFDADARLVALVWTVSAGLQAQARHHLARGTMARGDWLRQGWRTLGADLSAFTVRLGFALDDSIQTATVRGLRTLGRLRLLTGAVVMLDLALLARAATIADGDLLPVFSDSERVLVLLVGIAMLVPMVDVLQVQVRRTQRRAEPRRPAVLPIAVAGQQVETLDITPKGVGLAADHAPPIGSHTSFRLDLPRPDGPATVIDGVAVVRAATTLGDGRLRVGLEFSNLDTEARTALIRYCAIDHALLADRNREIPERWPQDLDVIQSSARRVGIRALTGVAALLGLLTVGFGPGAGAASAAEATVDVCLVDAGGDPIAGATVTRRTGGPSIAMGVTGAKGCVQGGSPSGAVTFEMTHNGVTASLSQNVSVDPTVLFSTRAVTVRLHSTSGAPVAGAQVRYFVDGWRSAGATGADGSLVIELLPTDMDFEIGWHGARFIQFRPADADPVVVFTTSRLA
ncbi:MAG: PilZ domain-containing protein, partial [Acidimicrobiia bacterium]|nr:PilZ domain-containing protein [Acidimicrobiia bacterium]